MAIPKPIIVTCPECNGTGKSISETIQSLLPELNVCTKCEGCGRVEEFPEREYEPEDYDERF